MFVSMLAILVCCAAVPGFAQNAGSPASKPAKPAAAALVVNLNTATSAQLEALPGVGAKVATRIIEYREKNGPFKKIEELMNVQGVGEKSFLKLKPQLTVDAKAVAAGQH
jgi:competence protein ComEA